MREDIAGNMTENHRAPFIPHLKRRGDIEIHLGIAHDCSIDEKRLLIRRLAMLHIDLAGHALHTIDH